MRHKYSKAVESGRVRVGPFGTAPGLSCGAFFIKRPPVGPRFKIIVGDGLGWDHVSVSLERRTPTWDEMCWVKNLFFGVSETVIQYHPAVEEYVNTCGNCLHLWRPQDEIVLMPPIECV